jgi:hypothetical protein
MSTSGVRFTMASWAFKPSDGSMSPIAPRHGPLWAVNVQRILLVPGTARGSMKVAGLSTRLPKKTPSCVPSGWIVHKLWMGIAGRSTYSHRP